MRNLGFIPFFLFGALAGIGYGVYNSTPLLIVGLLGAASSLAFLILSDRKK